MAYAWILQELEQLRNESTKLIQRSTSSCWSFQMHMSRPVRQLEEKTIFEGMAERFRVLLASKLGVANK